MADGVQVCNKRLTKSVESRDMTIFCSSTDRKEDTQTARKEAMKLNKARKRGYIRTGEVKSLRHYLLVPRGEIYMYGV